VSLGGLVLAPRLSRISGCHRAQRRRITGQSDVFVSRARRTVESEFPVCVISTSDTGTRTGLERSDRRARRFVLSAESDRSRCSAYRCCGEGKGRVQLNIPRRRLILCAWGEEGEEEEASRARMILENSDLYPQILALSLVRAALSRDADTVERVSESTRKSACRPLLRVIAPCGGARKFELAPSGRTGRGSARFPPADFRWRESTPRLRELVCLLPACERFRSRACPFFPVIARCAARCGRVPPFPCTYRKTHRRIKPRRHTFASLESISLAKGGREH